MSILDMLDPINQIQFEKELKNARDKGYTDGEKQGKIDEGKIQQRIYTDKKSELDAEITPEIKKTFDLDYEFMQEISKLQTLETIENSQNYGSCFTPKGIYDSNSIWPDNNKSLKLIKAYNESYKSGYDSGKKYIKSLFEKKLEELVNKYKQLEKEYKEKNKEKSSLCNKIKNEVNQKSDRLSENILCPYNTVIRKIFVTKDSSFSKGQILISIGDPGVTNYIYAPKDGRVSNIYVSERQLVQKCNKLLSFLPSVLDLKKSDVLLKKGIVFFEGNNCPKDYDKAEFFLRDAIVSNPDNTEAYFYLGKLYDEKNNTTEAASYYKIAANKGHNKAMNNLGCIYLNNTLYNDAMHYFKTAARNGNAVANYNLGIMYENGYGCTSDKTIAISWYQKAFAAGYIKGLDRIRELNKGAVEKAKDKVIETKDKAIDKFFEWLVND